jgi:long-chain acyl-CoA synthetase
VKKHEFSNNRNAIQDERIIKRIQKEVESFNLQLGEAEKIKRFELVAHSWSSESGELTPTLKLKRKEILEKYARLIEKIYYH